MDQEEITLPAPPCGYKYKLVRDKAKVTTKNPTVKNKDPSELTPRQLATLKYREKNKEKIRAYHREYRLRKEESNLSDEPKT